MIFGYHEDFKRIVAAMIANPLIVKHITIEKIFDEARTVLAKQQEYINQQMDKERN